MRFLVAADSVHTTAAACDYLEPRLDTGDTVTVVTVPDPDTWNGEDALNVANARLLGDATVETERPEPDGDPASAILGCGVIERRRSHRPRPACRRSQRRTDAREHGTTGHRGCGRSGRRRPAIALTAAVDRRGFKYSVVEAVV